jgi:hypothetical protein
MSKSIKSMEDRTSYMDSSTQPDLMANQGNVYENGIIQTNYTPTVIPTPLSHGSSDDGPSSKLLYQPVPIQPLAPLFGAQPDYDFEAHITTEQSVNTYNQQVNLCYYGYYNNWHERRV